MTTLPNWIISWFRYLFHLRITLHYCDLITANLTDSWYSWAGKIVGNGRNPPFLSFLPEKMMKNQACMHFTPVPINHVGVRMCMKLTEQNRRMLCLILVLLSYVMIRHFFVSFISAYSPSLLLTVKFYLLCRGLISF